MFNSKTQMDIYTIGLDWKWKIFLLYWVFPSKNEKMHFQLLSEITLNKSPPICTVHLNPLLPKLLRLCHKRRSLSQKNIFHKREKKLYKKSQHHLYICLNLVVNNSVENNVRIRKEQRWNTCGFTSLTKVLDGSVGEKNKERIAQFS